MLDNLFITGFGDGKLVIYQLLDCTGTPIYIGQTNNLDRRLTEHAKDKAWFGEVRSVWFESVESKYGRYFGIGTPAKRILGSWEMERKRIKEFNPRYNRKPGKVPIFAEPSAQIGCVVPGWQRDCLHHLAIAYSVKPTEMLRHVIANWLDEHRAEIAAALAAPAEATAVPV